jgi:RNA polymerase sigma-70 factor, ECF subfamily
MADSQELRMVAGLAQAGELEPSPLEAEIVALFDQLREPLLRYLLGFPALVVQDCEEITQEAFLALFQHLQRGRPRHNLRGWLFRVVHNLALKRVQHARRDSLDGLRPANGVEETAVDPALNPEDAWTQGERRRLLLAVVQALPEQDQRCLVLRAEGLTYREIAEVLEMSLGAVAKSLERSLARMARAAER